MFVNKGGGYRQKQQTQRRGPRKSICAHVFKNTFMYTPRTPEHHSSEGCGCDVKPIFTKLLKETSRELLLFRLIT